jgi:hypothetical protein
LELNISCEFDLRKNSILFGVELSAVDISATTHITITSVIFIQNVWLANRGATVFKSLARVYFIWNEIKNVKHFSVFIRIFKSMFVFFCSPCAL